MDMESRKRGSGMLQCKQKQLEVTAMPCPCKGCHCCGTVKMLSALPLLKDCNSMAEVRKRIHLFG